jgi:transcriptional regulator with XRE-family HTH domain
MDLKEYRALTGVPYAHLARQCGCSRAHISQIARGIAQPSFKMAERIEWATFKQVPRALWYPPGSDPPKET